MASADPNPPGSQPATAASASPARHTHQFRIRYSETDQMGTFYNSRALEWFEVGRSELLRSLGFPYVAMESRGVFLPLVEAHVEYDGRARYDDLLSMTSIATLVGRARLRCDNTIVHADTGRGVAHGYTVHAFTDPSGRPIRPPAWFTDLLLPQLNEPESSAPR